MSARIAPESIGGSAANFRSRTALGDSAPTPPPPEQRTGQHAPLPTQQETAARQGLPPLPTPPPQPGAIFAAALLSGQLSPKPTSEREIMLRLGSAALPAQGSLALHDRRV